MVQESTLQLPWWGEPPLWWLISSAKSVKMGSMLCQIGNEMRMLTTATNNALKAFREAIA
jgi:hypothetical protein